MSAKEKKEQKTDLVLENEDLKHQIKELQEKFDETHKKLLHCDAMLGRYMEKLKLSDAKIVWYETVGEVEKQQPKE